MRSLGKNKFAPFKILLKLCFRSEGNIFTRRYKMPKEPNYRQIEKKILDDVLNPEVYDPRIRPAGLNSTGEGTQKGKTRKL